MTLRMDQSSQGAILNDEKQILNDCMTNENFLFVSITTLI